MFSSPKDELLNVEQILREGKLNKALELARNLESSIELDTNEQMEVKSLQLEIMHDIGDHEKVYKLADLVINLSDELKLPLHKLDGLIFKALSLIRLKKFKERDEIFNKLTALLEQKRNNQDLEFVKREIHYHNIKGELFLDEYEFEKSLESYNHSLLLNEKLNNMYQKSIIIKNIADVYFYNGHLSISLQNYEMSLEIATDLGYRRLEAMVYHMLAGLKFKEDKLKEALVYEQKSGSIFQELNDEYNIAFHCQYLGFLYRGLGQIDKSLDYLSQAKRFFEEIGHEARVINVLVNIIGVQKLKGDYEGALASLNIYYKMNEALDDKHCLGIAHNVYGSIYTEKGELDKALNHYMKSLEIFQKFKTLDTLGNLYYNLGDLYLKQDELDKSLEYNLLALEFREKMQMGDKLSRIAISLKSLVVLSLILEKQEEALNFLERIEVLNSETDSIEIEHLYLLAKSIFLKSQGNEEKVSESKNILIDLINRQNVDYMVSIESILNLCELLLFELSTTEDMSLLIETKGFVSQLTEIASFQHLYPLLVESYLLQAQLALVEIKVDDAKYFISTAQQIAEEKGLKRLAVTVSNEYDLILDKIDQWNEFTRRLPTVAEKLELSHIELMLNQMIKKRMIDTSYAIKEEEFPLILLILTNSGTILFTEDFDVQLENEDLENILANLREIKTEDHSNIIQRNRYQEYTYLVKNIDSFIFSYIFEGKAYSSVNKMKLFLLELKEPSPIFDMLKHSEESGQPISVLDRMAISQKVNDIFGRKSEV